MAVLTLPLFALASGGCLAVGYGMGRDVFAEPDPHCFFADRERLLVRPAAAEAG